MLKFDGVELILVSENFISVKKNDVVNWDSLKPTIISSINDYFEKNEKPILSKDDHENNDEKEQKILCGRREVSQNWSLKDCIDKRN